MLFLRLNYVGLGERKLLRKTVSGIMLSLLVISILTSAFNIQPVKASGSIYIRADGSIDPPTAPIQRDGDLYTLTGNITSDTDGIVIERNNIVIDGNGYTLQGPGNGSNYPFRGIGLSGRENVAVHNIQIQNFYFGILLYSSSNNSISGNNITNNGNSIFLGYSSSNSISGNNIANGGDGICLSYSSLNNIIVGNNIANNGYGIALAYYSSNNSVSGNNMTANIWFNIGFLNSSSSKVYHNNFIRNPYGIWQVYDWSWDWSLAQPSINVWDDGYPSGGNYWSDYSGIDLYSGPYQNETESDGIGDTPYIIYANNTDQYPLMSHWSERVRAHVIDVPFHYQTVDHYCGSACLEMAFDYYGEDINQSEIADVARTIGEPVYSTFTDELRRAAHFSNTSTSMGYEMPGNITGYTLRQLGYAAFEQWSMTIDQLKTLIDNNLPIILLMWYSPNHVSGHYRVALGYNNTHIILHDPWNNVEWGGTYGGPYLAFNYSTFLDLWSYSGYWGLFTSPWNIEINTPSNVQQGDNFTVTANITYPCPAPFPTTNYPSSLCNATITLPTGLVLAGDETAKKALGNILPGNSAIVNWTIIAENCGTYNLTVETEGKVAGSVSAHAIFPSYNYEDRIGAKSNCVIDVFGHDISVKNIVSSKTIVGQGYNITMNVTTKNEGSFMETFNLTIYANTTIIATITNTTLSSGDSIVITFIWNTTGFAKGNYTIWAYAWPVLNETDTADNIYIDGWVVISIYCDVNGDRIVDLSDILDTALAFGSTPGHPLWNPNCDLDNNGIVDISDILEVALHFGETDP
jgi:parallel beta-helix repeat protein